MRLFRWKNRSYTTDELKTLRYIERCEVYNDKLDEIYAGGDINYSKLAASLSSGTERLFLEIIYLHDDTQYFNTVTLPIIIDDITYTIDNKLTSELK